MITTSQSLTSYQKLLIALLALLQFTIVLDFMVLSPLGDVLMKSLTISPSGFGLVVMIVIYTNLSPTPMWEVVVINMILFMGIMSRMIPATTLTTSIPEIKDRGAFMSINSSLQQMAGGLAAIAAGFIVTQQTPDSPLQNYNILGFVVSLLIVVCLFFVYRVSETVKRKNFEKAPDTATIYME